MEVPPFHSIIIFEGRVNIDVMLDAQGYKSTAEDTKQLDALAREIFAEETGKNDLDNLISHDRDGNLWIYASSEAKHDAQSRPPHPDEHQPHEQPQDYPSSPPSPSPATGPLFKSLASISTGSLLGGDSIMRPQSEPTIPTIVKDEGYSYAKTLRLTSDQLVFLLKWGSCIEIA